MTPLAFPNLPANLKLVGSNIVPKRTDVTGNSDIYAAWNYLWNNWDWKGWIKPQIDLLASTGANCVRLMANSSMIAGHGTPVSTTGGTAPQITAATFVRQMDQFISYCAARGIYCYFACNGGELATGQTANFVDYFTVFAATVCSTNYSNVVAIDLMNEVGLASGIGAEAAAYFSGCRTVMAGAGLKSLPLTMSVVTTAIDFSTGTLAALGPVADFYDIHIYSGLTGNTSGGQRDMLGDVTNANKQLDINPFNLPWVVGEAGSALSVGALAQSAAYDQFVLTARRPNVRMVLSWGIFPQNTTTTDDWGMFDATFAPRTWLTNRIAQMPHTFPVSLEWRMNFAGAAQAYVAGTWDAVFGQGFADTGDGTGNNGMARIVTTSGLATTYTARKYSGTPNTTRLYGFPYGSDMTTEMSITGVAYGTDSTRATVGFQHRAMYAIVTFHSNATFNGQVEFSNGTIGILTPLTFGGVADNAIDRTHDWKIVERSYGVGPVIYDITVTDLTANKTYDVIRIATATATSYTINNIAANGTVYAQAGLTNVGLNTVTDQNYNANILIRSTYGQFDIFDLRATTNYWSGFTTDFVRVSKTVSGVTTAGLLPATSVKLGDVQKGIDAAGSQTTVTGTLYPARVHDLAPDGTPYAGSL